MLDGIHSPAQATYLGIAGQLLFTLIAVIGLACFAYVVLRRMTPLFRSAADPRFGNIGIRAGRVLQFWLVQWKQPRYRFAGAVHIVIFTGFLVLSIRSISMALLGVIGEVVLPGLPRVVGDAYAVAVDYAATVVLLAAIMAAIRRIFFQAARYAVPEKYGHGHTAEAILILGLIALLMLSASMFEASQNVLTPTLEPSVPKSPPLTLNRVWEVVFPLFPLPTLQRLYLGSYLVHELTFFAFLCFLPFGKHFHVVTSLFNVYFAKLDRGELKPVRWDVKDEQLDQIKNFGVKRFEDFTWKQILDFYSCADCGRCSDQCPSNAAGRPLSPRFLTIKARDFAFRQYPVVGKRKKGTALIGPIYSDDEIWSCTTCGACEQECPLLVEYIDKIVDLRRGMIDDGRVPATLQKPLKALAIRGNPYGKPEKKRADWTKAGNFEQTCGVKTVDSSHNAERLYFVDSITSYDGRMQAIGQATARILEHIGEDFGILGPQEKDSGHEVRRFGEEMLFITLRDHNTEAIQASGICRIVTSDPHAFNALKHDYKSLPPVEHISQVIEHGLKHANIRFKPVQTDGDIYTYHDPCYLGRHNHIYDSPRHVLDAIPDLKRVEMKRCRDRSFCCGGGGLMLFYEPKEEQRMGVMRVQMAADAGANVIVTACPFCLANIEDGIKVAGMEDKMAAIDLAELVDQQIAR